MDRTSKVKMVIAGTALGMFGAAGAIAQDKYALRTPSGIAFSDFKGYEDWAVISSARTDEVLKVIVGNRSSSRRTRRASRETASHSRRARSW